jgi:hypothetical protein
MQSVLFKTKVLYEFELVEEALTKNNIPHYSQITSQNGMTYAFDSTKEFSFGDNFTLSVDETDFEKSLSIIDSIEEIEKEVPFWAFDSNPRAKKLYFLLAFINLIVVLSIVWEHFLNFLDMLLNFFGL